MASECHLGGMEHRIQSRRRDLESNAFISASVALFPQGTNIHRSYYVYGRNAGTLCLPSLTRGDAIPMLRHMSMESGQFGHLRATKATAKWIRTKHLTFGGRHQSP
ncbi:hypothetical protein MRB53_036297 [Persea americana]|nr:hypothetical protein MRB53_036475 [Persea americana]KAJ8614884.1 hypothetical protein MRB53_036297 [Persea americana]